MSVKVDEWQNVTRACVPKFKVKVRSFSLCILNFSDTEVESIFNHLHAYLMRKLKHFIIKPFPYIVHHLVRDIHLGNPSRKDLPKLKDGLTSETTTNGRHID